MANIVLGAVNLLNTVLGTGVGHILAYIAVWKGVQVIGGWFAAAATAISTKSAAMAASLNAASRRRRRQRHSGRPLARAQGAVGRGLGVVATNLGKAASSLPLVGIAIYALVEAYDALDYSAGEAADAVVNGELSMRDAIEARAKSIELQSRVAGNLVGANERGQSKATRRSSRTRKR